MKWGGVIQAILNFVLGMLSGKMTKEGEKAGQAQQANADMQEVQHEAEVARGIQNRVDAADDVELERMSERWTKPGSSP